VRFTLVGGTGVDEQRAALDRTRGVEWFESLQSRPSARQQLVCRAHSW
jgi:hypothetical protein